MSAQGTAEGQMILMGGRDSPSVTSPYQLLKVMLWYSMPSPAMVSMLLQAESRSTAYALLWPVHLVSIKLSKDLSEVFLWYTDEVLEYSHLFFPHLDKNGSISIPSNGGLTYTRTSP